MVRFHKVIFLGNEHFKASNSYNTIYFLLIWDLITQLLMSRWPIINQNGNHVVLAYESCILTPFFYTSDDYEP